MYELLIDREGSGRVPNRNYANEKGIVVDKNLFPYHSACYPLLDMYELLYTAKEESVPGQNPDNIVWPSNRNLIDEFENPDEAVAGVLRTSREAITQTLLHDEEQEFAMNSVGFNQGFAVCAALLRHYRHRDFLSYLHATDDSSDATVSDNTQSNMGLRGFPQNPKERNSLLLKLLMHSMSDLQRDLRLSMIIVYRMVQWKLFDDADFFKQFLAVLLTGRVKCDGHCATRYFEDPERDKVDHYCMEVSLTRNGFIGGGGGGGDRSVACLF